MATDYPIGPDEDRNIDGIRMTEDGGAEVDMLPGEEPEVEELPDGSAVVKLEDFMRRRSKIELVVHDDDINTSAGLREVAEILFGDDADHRLAEYFGGADTVPTAVRNGPTPADVLA